MTKLFKKHFLSFSNFDGSGVTDPPSWSDPKVDTTRKRGTPKKKKEVTPEPPASNTTQSYIISMVSDSDEEHDSAKPSESKNFKTGVLGVFKTGVFNGLKTSVLHDFKAGVLYDF